jgi:BON domain
MDVQPRIAEPFVNDPLADEELGSRVALCLGHCGFPSIDRLRVTAKNGVVTLHGVALTYHIRQLAIAKAMRVAGVRHLVDEIRMPISDPNGRSACRGTQHPASEMDCGCDDGKDDSGCTRVFPSRPK